MTITEFLQREDDVPQIIDPLDRLDLEDDPTNRAIAHRMLTRRHRVLEDTPGFTFLRVGDDYNGYFIQYIKSLDLIGYYVRYSASKGQLLGHTVTQIMLWRRTGTPYVPGRTRHVFFDYLLKIWPAVMSDGQQTPRGVEFWRNMLAEASVRPEFAVGFVHSRARGTGVVEWWDGSNFDVWLNGRDAWGTEDIHRDRRFIIANRSA